MAVGRNDPCPCGSGKKYKRCHGAESVTRRPEVVRANALKAADQELTSHLLRFAKSRYGLEWFDIVLSEYSGGGPEVSEHEMSLAIPWALHFRRDESDTTVASAWAAQHARRATSDQQTVLDAYADAWLSIWEVTRVERGVGTALLDRLTGIERFAQDVSSSSTLDLHDTMLAIVLDLGGVSFFGGAHPQPLPPFAAETVLGHARKLCGVRTRAVRPEKLRDTDLQLDLVDAWNASVDQMLAAPSPIISNTDGDLLSLTTDDFELIAPTAEVVALLARIPGAEEPERENGDIAITFIKPGNATHRGWDNTVMGRAIVGPRSLRVETNSIRRADELRGAIERHLGGMVRFRLRQETNTADVLARASASAASSRGGGVSRESTPPELAAALRSFREKHMRSWVDEEIPLLGGLTPRAAARTPRARQALEVLLKDIERAESRLPADERIDLSWLRPELGLE